MTRKQMAFIIAVNALISTAISVVVALLIVRPAGVAFTPTPTTAVAVLTQPVVAATPTPGPVIHTVQSGDTISGLALQYDIPEADIIAANQLTNPNFLQVGMELVIPVGGLAQATATFTPAPTATDTPIPFEPPSADITATAATEAGATTTPLLTSLPTLGELQIDISEVIGAGNVEEERVIITNNGERLADMAGWTLSDVDGNIYTFPNFRLWGNGSSVTVHSRIGQDGSPPANFYWGKLESIWSAGETVTLKNAQGEVISDAVVAP
jgi:LysM repeat protein